MEKKIYIVTAGEYSDYHIEAAFSTKKKANEYVQQHGMRCDIEEYDLDEEVVRKTKLWRCSFYLDNNMLFSASPILHEVEKLKDTCFVAYDRFSTHKFRIELYVDADTMDKAVKIARERLAAVKANEYIWLRLTRPYDTDRYGGKMFERFNINTNEFIKG